MVAEWYVAESGRTVFFRRYNGVGFKKDPADPTSFESLAGNLEVEFEGKTSLLRQISRPCFYLYIACHRDSVLRPPYWESSA